MTAHWAVAPELDERTWLAPQRRGRLAPGHSPTPPCRACVEEAPPAPRPAPRARPKIPPELRRRQQFGAVVPLPVERLTTRQIVLVAARDVALATPGFSIGHTALVLRAWRLAPARFGLQGVEQEHPDAGRVAAKIAGKTGACGLGWLRRTSPGCYVLTGAGKAAVRALSAKWRPTLDRPGTVE